MPPSYSTLKNINYKNSGNNINNKSTRLKNV